MKKLFWVLFSPIVTILFTSTLVQAQNGFNCVFNADTGQWQVSATDNSPCVNSIVTAVPFLRIVPDARAGAMGDAGIATSADPNAMHFNASKIAFSETERSIAATYTPWLRSLGLSDVYMAYVSGYTKFGKKDDQAIGISLRYFSLGQINFTNESGGSQGTGRPNEFALNAGYFRKLSNEFSVGINGKFIYSNLAADQIVGGVEIKPAISAAADLSFTYKKPIKISGSDAELTVGLAVTNIGPKISYTKSVNRDFIPTNLGIGAGLSMDFDEFNSMGFYIDFNKLLVPTPPLDEEERETYKDQGTITAMFNSFGDAPNGFSEEMKEFSISTGIEYWYDKQFAVRSGFYWEDKTKGNRQFFTVGLGLQYNIVGINFSYLVPTSNQRNPLDNTLRFSLVFDLGNGGYDSGF